MPFYAVRVGYEPGIYSKWEEAEKQVKGYPKAVFKKFEDKSDAFEYIVFRSPQKSEQSQNEADESKDQCQQKTPIKFDSKRKLNEPTTTTTTTDHPQTIDNNNDFNKNAASTASANTEEKTKTPAKKTNSPVKKVKLDVDGKIRVELKTSPNNKATEDGAKATALPDNTYLTEYENKKFNFSFNNKSVCVYTDGACSNNGQKNAAAGIGVYWAEDHPLNISKRLIGIPTNNRAEITAAIVAISQAINYNASELTIYTDSKFMINCIEKWIKNWKMNGWKLVDGKPVKNIDDLKRLDDLCSKIKVTWKYIAGHKGHDGNTQADKLATDAIR